MQVNDAYFANNFNTFLSDENQAKYQRWVNLQSLRRGRDVSQDVANYDLAGYWLNGGYKDTTGSGHMPDTYKKPNHPTFSNESVYHGIISPWGTRWEGGQWGNGTFTPSAHMLAKTHDWSDLQNYMKVAEPGVVLVPPLKPR